MQYVAGRKIYIYSRQCTVMPREKDNHIPSSTFHALHGTAIWTYLLHTTAQICCHLLQQTQMTSKRREKLEIVFCSKYNKSQNWYIRQLTIQSYFGGLKKKQHNCWLWLGCLYKKAILLVSLSNQNSDPSFIKNKNQNSITSYYRSERSFQTFL